MDENELPPENGDPFTDPNELAELETELPTSEEVPPEQVQERLEAPTGFHWTPEVLSGVSVADGSFEASAADWTAVNATITRSTAQAKTGAASGLLAVTGSPSFAYARPVEAKRAPVSPGTEYVVNAWIRSANWSVAELAIDWFDGSSGYISTDVVPVAFSLESGAWFAATFRATAPAGAASAAYGPTVPGSPPAGTTVWFDDVQILAVAEDATLIETDPATQPGVEMTWTEPDPELLKKASDGSVTEGQATTSTGGTP